MLATDDTLITLTGGLTIHTSVAVWLIDASFRLTFTVEDDELVIFPNAAITPADDAFIRAHKSELIAAVSYCDRMAEMPL